MGAVTRAVTQAAEEAWPEVGDLLGEDEENTSPGDIEEDADDLPAAELQLLYAAIVAQDKAEHIDAP